VLGLEEWMDIRALRKEGHSIKAITRLTGFSRNTVRRVLREAGPTGFRTPDRESCLDPFKAYVKERVEACALSAVRLLGDGLQPKHGPTGAAGGWPGGLPDTGAAFASRPTQGLREGTLRELWALGGADPW